MTNQDQFYEKLSADYDAFIDQLRVKSPDDILVAAYEKVCKEEIVIIFENSFYSEQEYAALLQIENPLDKFYAEWLDIDSADMEAIRGCIEDTVKRETGVALGAEAEKETDDPEWHDLAGHEEAALIQTTEEPPSTQALNGKVACFDVVISVADEFPFLVGEVNAVDKRYAAEHNLGPLYDEVFVDFRSEEYSEQRKKEIGNHFGQRFDRISLDNVPMAPDLLIVVPERDIPQLLESRENAEAYCKAVLEKVKDPETELIARIEQNYADFKQSLDGFSNSELIEVSGRISAMQYGHRFLTAVHDFTDVELQYYLQFQNPLEVVADDWYYRNLGLDDFTYSMDLIYEVSDDVLKEYPLMSDIDKFADYSMHHRYMGVDLTHFLGEIAEKVIVHHPNDWNIDKEHLQKAVASENPEDRRLMWHVSSYGTHMNTERETFIKNTGAFNTWVDYRANEPDMFGYIIEVTGKSGDVITGNVFEIGDYYPHTMHVRENALIFTEVSLTYSNDWGVNAGKTVMVPRFEYDDDRHRLMSGSGNVTAIQYHPYEVVRTMSDVLQQERSRRMAYPIGSQTAHLKSLSEKLAEIRQPPEREKPAPRKEKSAFDKALNRGKEKSEAYKAQKSQDPNKTNTKNKEALE